MYPTDASVALCQGCKGQIQVPDRPILAYPPCIVIRLDRSDHDIQGHGLLSTPVSVNERITLPGHSESYTLLAVSSYNGNKRKGHYVTYKKCRTLEDAPSTTACWVKIDDLDLQAHPQTRLTFATMTQTDDVMLRAYLLWYAKKPTDQRQQGPSPAAPPRKKQRIFTPAPAKHSDDRSARGGDNEDDDDMRMGGPSGVHRKLGARPQKFADEIAPPASCQGNSIPWSGTIPALLHHLNLERVPNKAEHDKPGDCLPLTMEDIAKHFGWQERNWREWICNVYEANQALMHKQKGLWQRDGSGRCMKQGCEPCEKSLGVSYDSITTRQSNICDLQVDAIVNAANSHLRHGAGVAHAISQRSGQYQGNQSIVDQESATWISQNGEVPVGKGAAVTSAGNMSAKYVIHVVGPMCEVTGKTNPTERTQLRQAVITALKTADSNDCASVALPIISAGIYGFPLKEACNIIVKAAHAFSPSARHVQKIILCGFSRPDTAALETALRTYQAQTCATHTCTACSKGQCFQRPPLTTEDTTVDDFIHWLRMEQRWMSAIEVCTYAGEIQRLSQGKRRIIMIHNLTGRDGALLFWCKSMIASTPQEGEEEERGLINDPKSNPWIQLPVRMEDLDPNRDVYILYTDNSHFSFAKPVSPHENSRPSPAIEIQMRMSDMPLRPLTGPKGCASGKKGKEPAEDTPVLDTQSYSPSEQRKGALVTEFLSAIKDPPPHDVAREWLRARNWIVDNSIADWKTMMRTMI
jgi:O-acetyl-ADP-ribose deacetylase